MTTTPPEPTARRPLPGQEGTPVQRAALAVMGVVAVVALSVAAVLADPGLVPVTDPGAVGSIGAASPSAPVAPTGRTTEVTVTVDAMAFTPARIEVPRGDALLITFTNTGDQRHDLVFGDALGTPAIAPGASATVDVGVVGADLEGWCSLPGHRQMGMTLQVVATGAGAPPSTAGAHDDPALPASPVPSAAELQAAAASATPHPAELPPLDDATVRRYTFTVTEAVQEVAPGVTRVVWTYNGSSPGPLLHGRVGDTFEITLVNEGTMGHSIDFHAGELAPDEPMRTIEPGERLQYTFTADRAGVWMYHCSTMPTSQHIANGMFGAVVIEPANLDPVDRQFVLVQSEQYLGADGGPTDATKAAAAIPDIVTFNGRAFQYDAHPLTAAVGDRVRFWVLDAGPNAALSFHVVGGQFDTVWTEGAYSVRRGTGAGTAGTTGAQTLPLLAAQGGFVELVLPEAGHYPFVNHQMSLAEKGAHGVLLVEPAGPS